jgi:putative ABC transport system permease protein
MIRNYLNIAYRNLIRNKFFSAVNILGLTLGISTCLVIFLFVFDELSYDRDHPDKENIYRIFRGGDDWASISPAMLQSAVLKKMPGIEEVCKFNKSNAVITYKDKFYNENAVVFADSNFLDFFRWSFPNCPQNALFKPNSIVLTQEMANKYFGDKDPIGEILSIDNEAKVVVTGIIDKIPSQQSIQFDFLVNNNTLYTINKSALENWDNSSMHNYLRLNKATNPDSIVAKLPVLVGLARNYEKPEKAGYRLQNYQDVHLHSQGIGYDHGGRGDYNIVMGFLAIAIIVLLLACFNYMNLSTAQSARRAKEMGLRKTIGANRRQIVSQLLFEAFLITCISLILALILVETIMPWFNQLTDKDLSLYQLNLWVILPVLIGFVFIVSILAGFYPAFILSGYSPVKVLKGSTSSGFNFIKRSSRQHRFKQIMVIFQLASSVALIIGSIIIDQQLKFARTQDLGHQPEQLLKVTNNWDKNMQQRFTQFTDLLAQNPSIVKTGCGYNGPGEDINNWSTFNMGEGKETIQAGYIGIDKDYFDVLGAEIIKGRNFSSNTVFEEENHCIVNETVARQLKIYDDPIGQEITGFWSDSKKTVVGMVKDISYKSLQETVPPVVYRVCINSYPYSYHKMLIRIRPENKIETIEFIYDAWSKVAPTWPLRLTFVDQAFENMYLSEKKVSKLLSLFTILAISISLLGLYGLIAFVAVSRQKEISIRKVLGSSVCKIVMRMGREFFILTAIANIIAWPMVYLISKKWLEHFAYSIPIHFIWFVLAGISVLFFVMLIVGYHAIRAANRNPVEALKYE